MKKHFLIFTGTAALTAGLSAYISTHILVKTALDREQPKIMQKNEHKISGRKSPNKFEAACRKAGSILRSREHEFVKITTRDGIKLAGHLFPCDNPKRIIIAFHGWRSSWSNDFGMISDFWHNQNCTVLYAEQRGQNESGGAHMEFGLTERFDCLEWIEYINSRFGKSIPIYLAGISMGATTVLMAADLPLTSNIHGIMADCGFTSPKAIWKHVIRCNLHMSYALRGKIADSICRKKINMRPDEHSTTAALANTSVPILLIHGTDDRFVPIKMSYDNYKACSSSKRIFIVPGADHAMSYCTAKSDYEHAVTDFWDTFDCFNPCKGDEI